MNKKNDDRKNVVVVGGGGAGAAATHALSKSLDSSRFNLILIDPRPNHMFLPSTIRLPVVNPDGLEDKVLVPFQDIFYNGNGTFYQNKVVSISRTAAEGGDLVLDNEDRIHYDVLILSPGSTWHSTFDFSSDVKVLHASWATSRKIIKAAQNIVLVGGGAVGLELSGEIRSEYPDKTVTIVHGAQYPLNKAYPDKFRKAVEARLVAKNIRLVSNDFIDAVEINEGKVTTRNGKPIKADLVLSTYGTKPNTEFIGRSLGADALSNSGRVKVRPTLQLLNHPEIFAMGDIVDHPEQKQLLKAQAHAAIVAPNVLAYLANRNLKPYKGEPEVLILTLGKEGGIAYLGFLWGIILGDWFVRLAKSKTLLVPTLKGRLGIKA